MIMFNFILRELCLMFLQLCPDADFTQELGGRIDRDSWGHDKRSSLDIMPPRASRGGSPSRGFSTYSTSGDNLPLPSVDPDDLVPSDDEIGQSHITEGIKRMAMDPLDRRFHGKSSGIVLVQTAMNLKREFAGVGGTKTTNIPPATRRQEFWSPHPVRHIRNMTPSIWMLTKNKLRNSLPGIGTVGNPCRRARLSVSLPS